MPAEESNAGALNVSTETDHFLSEEDLDLKKLSWEELNEVWNQWLLQASATNEQDAHLYSHGVFSSEPRS